MARRQKPNHATREHRTSPSKVTMINTFGPHIAGYFKGQPAPNVDTTTTAA
jgi:hypothetical protein